MRTIIIGDVHGCLDELKALINQLELTPSDRLFFIGDLINKGPNSAEPTASNI
jgi:bis(5'-nucleosyl)-tetraphosphatase (symmetrical)